MRRSAASVKARAGAVVRGPGPTKGPGIPARPAGAVGLAGPAQARPGKAKVLVRAPETIYRTEGSVTNGTFQGRWHFTFDRYYDPAHERFGTLRVLNDDVLSPGAVWPLHPHRDIEVVTYCVEGEFRHADERGAGGVLRPGWIQHTTVGRGMWHSEINNRPDAPLRFIQMWFLPDTRGLDPSVEQRTVRKSERTNRFLPLVSNEVPGALAIHSNAEVYSSFLEAGHSLRLSIDLGRGAYLYVLEGGPVHAGAERVPALGAAKVFGPGELWVAAERDAELLRIDVPVARAPS